MDDVTRKKADRNRCKRGNVDKNRSQINIGKETKQNYK
jgi:hypothetical protein